MNRGMLYALGSYLLWGVLPIYWKALGTLPALEITAHRVVWSALLAALVLALRHQWKWLRSVVRQPRVLLTVGATSILILLNWLIYIVAINQDMIVESSLGYYMNPLVNVLLAVIFLRERPRMGQWFAIAVAGMGVVYLTINYGRLPWIALGLAFSFAFYALLKKMTRLPALEGLFLEMAVLAVPLTIYLFILEQRGVGTFGHTSWTMTLLLVFSGVVTLAPLLLFSAGAMRVSLTMLGLLQYVAPTIQFVIGLALYHEPFSPEQLTGFSFIWTALALFTLEGFLERRRLALALRLAK